MANATTLWGIHAGRQGEAEDLFLVNGFIALGWHEIGHFGLIPNDHEAFRAKVAATYGGDDARSHGDTAGQLRRFVYEMTMGDAVAFRPKKSATQLVFLGRVAGPYVYNPVLSQRFPHVRRVEWQRSLLVDQLSSQARGQVSLPPTLTRITEHADEILALLPRGS